MRTRKTKSPPKTAQVSRNGTMFDVKFHVTQGQALALKHALEYYGEAGSIVGLELSQILNQHLQDSNIEIE
jgi:hypothetical protein